MGARPSIIQPLFHPIIQSPLHSMPSEIFIVVSTSATVSTGHYLTSGIWQQRPKHWRGYYLKHCSLMTALMANNEHHLQVIVDKFSEAANKFGLKISLSKTEAFFQTAPVISPQQPCSPSDGTQPKNVESFKWMSSIQGSTISSDGTLDREITARIQKAIHAFR